MNGEHQTQHELAVEAWIEETGAVVRRLRSCVKACGEIAVKQAAYRLRDRLGPNIPYPPQAVEHILNFATALVTACEDSMAKEDRPYLSQYVDAIECCCEIAEKNL
jgi:hypothetical protein